MYSLRILVAMMTEEQSTQWLDLISVQIKRRFLRNQIPLEVSPAPTSTANGALDNGMGPSKRIKLSKQPSFSESFKSSYDDVGSQSSQMSLFGLESDSEMALPSRISNRHRTQTHDTHSDSQSELQGVRFRRATGGRSFQQNSPLQELDMNTNQGRGLVPVPAPSVSKSKPVQLPECTVSNRGTRLGWEACKENLEVCHRGFLISKLQSLEMKYQENQSLLKKARRQLAAQTRENNKLLCKLNAKHTPDDEALSVTKVSVKLTDRGMIALGIRKSLALTSAVGFPLAALIDTSRQTVTRSEIIVWAAICSRTRAFHNLMYARLEAASAMLKDFRAHIEQNQNRTVQQIPCMQLLADTFGDFVRDTPSEKDAIERDLNFSPVYSTPWMFMRAGQDYLDISSCFLLGGTFISGDATCSSIWRQSKLQGLLIHSSLLTNISALNHETQYVDAFSRHTAMTFVSNDSLDWVKSYVTTCYGRKMQYVCMYHFQDNANREISILLNLDQ